ncbi:MAG: DNA adenine methylase [Proteobacteria bacterium]|nr:DNA adenine methylase [Pseudomonadota bacterium]
MPAQPAAQRLVHFTPLRYPGGKGKLAAYVKKLIETNKLSDCEYVEPYAGGAAIAFELLFHEYVSHIHINDISRPIYAFWRSVLNHTEQIVRLIGNTPLTVRSWDKQKQIFAHPENHDLVTLGFATFFLNRTNGSRVKTVFGKRGLGGFVFDGSFDNGEKSDRLNP